MNLVPLALRLARMRLARQGVDLFVQMMPLDAPSGVLLRCPPPGTKINNELPGFYRGDFQVIVRGESYDDTEARMVNVVAALTLNQVDEGPQHFNFCRPTTQPVSFPLSRGNLVETSVQFEACWVE
jgi:hypothetical protein